MATTKVVLELDVQGEELEQLNAELQKTEQNFKDVQKEAGKASKSVDDVASNGGAIAILDQLTGGLATRLRDAYEASKLFNTSLRATRGALIATGVGALVVALGAVVAYWDDIVDFITDANVDLEEQNALLKDNLSITQAEQTALEAQIKLYEAQGKNVDDLLEKRKQLLETQRLENQLLLANVIQQRLALEEEASKRADLAFVLTRGLFGSRGATEEDKRRIAELTAEAKGFEATILNIALQLEQIENPAQAEEPEGRNEQGVLGDIEAEIQRRINAEKLFQEEKKALIDGYELEITDVVLDNARFRAEQELEMERQRAKEQEAIDEAVMQNKLLVTANALGAISQLAGEQTTLGKALGIAQATIDTYVGANASLKIGGFTGIAQAVAIIATGLANVRRIASTQVPSIPGVAQGGAGGTAVALQAPQFNVVGDAGINSVAEAVGRQTNEPVRAYVAVQDITTAQDMERNTIQSSTV